MINLLKKRFVAYVIDFFVVSAFMWIISAILYVVANPYAIFPVYGYFPFIVPVLCIVYFTCCEKLKGATVGKALMYLQVVSYDDSPISWPQALIRSLTKIYYFPIIFDILIGRFFGKDRILGLLTRTAVVELE